MATTKIDFSTFVLPVEAVKSFNELYVRRLVDSPALNEFTTFVTGIRNDTEIGLVDGDFGLVGKAAQGCGTRTPDAKTLATSLKKWELKRWEVFMQFCWTDLETNFGKFARKIGTDIPDLTATDFLNYMETVLDKTLVSMFFRFVWFNDTDAAAYTDSPAGVYNSTTTLPYLTLFDGYFKQLEEIISTTPARRTTLAAYNDQATFALQDSTLTNEKAHDEIINVIDGAPATLRSAEDTMILCTDSVARKAMRHLQKLGTPYNVDLTISGLKLLEFDGYKMISIPWWDKFIRAYQKDASKYNMPHRILMMTKSNFLIGMEGNQLFDTMKITFNDETEYTNLKIKDAMDAKIVDDELIQYGV